MKNLTKVSFLSILFLILGCKPNQDDLHLFILSGQSNMVRLNPQESFTPAVESAFGKKHTIVVKDAKGSMPIRMWYKNWKSKEDEQMEEQGVLYDRLMKKVFDSIQNKKITTVTFIWMQGERDAREKLASVYAQSLKGLYNQLSTDLHRDDVNFIIGRLSDFDMKNERYKDWTNLREAQVQVASSNPLFTWVNTDDLNDNIKRKDKIINNDLHMSAEGYKILGKRFADSAIALIEKRP